VTIVEFAKNSDHNIDPCFGDKPVVYVHMCYVYVMDRRRKCKSTLKSSIQQAHCYIRLIFLKRSIYEFAMI
jgi:hypothetical protein